MSDVHEPHWLELKIPPPVVAAVSAVMSWGLARAFPGLQFPYGISVPVAVVLALAGVFLAGWGIAAFVRSRTTLNPHQPRRSTALVSSGPYRFTRNPMYVGNLLVLTGWVAFLASPLALLGPAAFVLYINRFQIAPEERELERLFGADYAAYTARVRRWL